MFGKKKATDTEEKKQKKVRPKKERKKKEPKQKKEKKPKKEKKAKPPKKPKRKPPKPPKRPKPKKPKKKMNPLILVILLLTALVIAAAGALVFLTKQREKEEDDMYGPMFYFAEEDGIESIRSKIGNREIKGGYKPPVDLTAEKEEEKKSSSENKSKEEEEEAEEEKDPELAEVDVKLLTDQVLAYITPGDGVQEAQKYMTYLVQEKGFKLLTYPEGSEGEIPKEAPTPTPTQEAEEDKDKKDKKEDKEDAKESEEESEEFIPPEEGYYIAALDNKDSAEEGTATEIKRVRMEYNYDSYTLRLSTANGVVNDLIPPEPEEEESKPKGISLSNAVDTLQGMSAEQLQLPKAVTEYEMTPIQGRVVINGIDFFNVRAYEKGPERTLFFGGAYYVSSDGESVYKHDEMTGDVTLISGVDILAEAQQQNISDNGNATVQSGNN